MECDPERCQGCCSDQDLEKVQKLIDKKLKLANFSEK